MNEKTAIRSAEKTNGVLHDNRNISGSRFRFTVTYESDKPMRLDSNEKRN